MTTRYKLLFRGEVAKDQHPAVVRGRLQSLLKASDTQLEVLFSGKPVSIKKDVDETVAERYLDAFVKAGAKLEIVELDEAALAEIARKADMVAAAEAHKIQQAKEAEQQRQAQRQELQQAAAALAATLSDGAQSQSGVGAATTTSPSTRFALAEVGADLAPLETQTATPVAAVPTEHLTLAEVGGNLVEPAEAAKAELPPPVDTSHLSLDEAGATLGVPTDDAAAVDTLVEFDFELGGVGELLVESVAVEVPEIPDLSHFELESLPEPESTAELA